MTFYRVNKSSFKFSLIVAIVSWIPTILLLTTWRFNFGIEVSFCSLLFSILAIFSYFSCYVNNIKYVVSSLGIEAYDMSDNLLASNSWSDSYKIRRVSKGSGRSRSIWCEIEFIDNLYEFKWNNKVMYSLNDYCDAQDVIDDNIKDEKLSRKILVIIFTILILFYIFNMILIIR